MRRFRRRDYPAAVAILLVGYVVTASVAGSCRAGAMMPSGPALNNVRVAVALTRGLPLVQHAAENYPRHRSCFSCHHQTLPMLAMVAAQQHDFKIDENLLRAQADFTHKSFRNSHDDLRAGEGIGGKAMTVVYALWALRLADWKSDDTTTAMVDYLLKTQHADGYWTGQVARPPLEESQCMATALAAFGMQHYAVDRQRQEVDIALAKAKTWLTTAKLTSQEDSNGRFWGLYLLEAGVDEMQSARETVLKAQHSDGGWGQMDAMASDAYATGQTLYLLHATGLPTSDPAYQRGVDFLLKNQQPDGSWYVKSRSKPIQKEFDNGDPHGKDQFISTPASCWALAALALAPTRTAGVVTGTVTLDGEPPAGTTIKLDDAMQRATGRETFVIQPWLTGKGNGLANCVITLSATKPASPMPARPLEKAVFEKEGAAFAPRVLVVTPGTEVTLRNKDSPCRGFITTARWHSFNFLLDAGQERKVSFTRADVCAVTCGVRPYMLGYIVVVDTPYYAVTDGDGHFRITGVPPGDYHVIVWHAETGRLPPSAGPRDLTIGQSPPQLTYIVKASTATKKGMP